MIHELKIDLVPLIDIERGKKKSEIRINDRDYQVGDEIEFSCKRDQNIMPTASYLITHIHSGLGMRENYVVLSINKVGLSDKEMAEPARSEYGF